MQCRFIVDEHDGEERLTDLGKSKVSGNLPASSSVASDAKNTAQAWR
jgi:hypothetical protein